MTSIPSTIDFRTQIQDNSPPGHGETGNQMQTHSPPDDGGQGTVALTIPDPRVAAAQASHRAWDALLSKVEFRFPMRITAEVFYEGFKTGSYLRVSVRTLDRDRDPNAPQDFIVQVTRWLPVYGSVNPELFLMNVVKGLIEHEVEESVLFGGRRLFDPHIRVGAPCPACASAIAKVSPEPSDSRVSSIDGLEFTYCCTAGERHPIGEIK